MSDSEHNWNQHKLAAENAMGQGRLDLAETQWLIALRLAEDFEKSDKRYAFTLEKLAEFYFQKGKLDKAHLYCEQVLEVYSEILGPKHIDVACIAGNLAMICHARKNYKKAEKYYLLALDIKKDTLGSDHPEVTKLTSNYADLLRMTDRADEADQLKTGASLVTATGWKKSTGSFEAYSPKGSQNSIRLFSHSPQEPQETVRKYYTPLSGSAPPDIVKKPSKSKLPPKTENRQPIADTKESEPDSKPTQIVGDAEEKAPSQNAPIPSIKSIQSAKDKVSTANTGPYEPIEPHEPKTVPEKITPPPAPPPPPPAPKAKAEPAAQSQVPPSTPPPAPPPPPAPKAKAEPATQSQVPHSAPPQAPPPPAPRAKTEPAAQSQTPPSAPPQAPAIKLESSPASSPDLQKPGETKQLLPTDTAETMPINTGSLIRGNITTGQPGGQIREQIDADGLLPTAPGNATQQNLPAMPLNRLSTGNSQVPPAAVSPSQKSEPRPPGLAGTPITRILTKEESQERWTNLKDSAEASQADGQLKECESYWHEALEIAGIFGENDPKLSYTLESLANIKYMLENYRAAEGYYKRAYEIKFKVLGPMHIAIAGSANNLARLYYSMCEYDQAEEFSRQCINIYEKIIGPDNPNVASSLHNLATLYHVQRKYKEAEPAYKRSLEIKKKILGPEHPETVKLLKSYADLLRSTNRASEADELSSAAIGLISGTWKTFSIKDSASLASTDDRCDICAAKLDGAPKCPGCGFEVSIGVI